MRIEDKQILAVYDICEPKRLRKIAKIVEDYGDRVQKSVFELKIGPPLLKELHGRVNRIIDPEVDSVRYYIVCARDFQKRSSLGVNEYKDLCDFGSYKLI